MISSIVIEKDEFIAGIYTGRYYDNGFGGRGSYFATFTLTNKRVYVEYGYLKKENKRSIYHKDIVEVKDYLFNKNFILKENKKASNGWVYTIKHAITVGNSFSKLNDKMRKDILEFIEKIEDTK